MAACYVSEKCTYEQKTFIHSKVCVQPYYIDENLILHDDGHKYCFLHLPNKNKFLETFRDIIKQRIMEGNLDFSGVYFPEKFFCTTGMYGVFNSDVNFKFATFPNGAFFANEFKGEVNFWKTHFGEDVEIGDAKFLKNVRFAETIFEGNVTFYGISILNNSQLGLINIKALANSKIIFVKQRILEGSIMVDGNFDGTIEFNQTWDEETLNSEVFRFRISGIFNNSEKVLFRNMPLKPSSFIFADSIKFKFEKIDWDLKDSLIGDKDYVSNFRRLSENAENNNRFEEASKFRQMAFECERLERKERISKWWNELISCKDVFGKLPEKIKTIPFDLIHWAYRWTSYYGESWSRAAIVLLSAVFIIFPIFFAFTDFQVSSKYIPLQVVVKGCEDVISELKADCKIEKRTLNLFDGEAILHSLSTATLQSVEYRVPSRWASFWMLLEKIFAPLQTALLALAIRRKFMR